MLVHRRVTLSIKFAGTHLYTWVERGTLRVKCLAQEHNSPQTGLEPGPLGPESSALIRKPPLSTNSSICHFPSLSLDSDGVYFVPAFNGLQVNHSRLPTENLLNSSYTALERFEHTALFLRLDPPSTRKRSFWETLFILTAEILARSLANFYCQ